MKMMHLQSAQNNLWKREQRTWAGGGAFYTFDCLLSLLFCSACFYRFNYNNYNSTAFQSHG